MNPLTRERCVIALLYFVPMCIGVLFWADTSAHGDSVIYRRFILGLQQTGVLRLASMEWYHPGHFLMLWPVFASGRGLGVWDDPLHAISLVNFVSSGWAAHAVYSTWRVLHRDDSWLAPLTAAAALATIPAWLWQSQEGMSDVVGTAFVIAVTCRLMRHHAQGETSNGAWALTGFLAAWAGLIRVSSALFLPLWGWLVFCAIYRNQGLTWSRVAIALGIGVLLPMVVLFGYLTLQHGADSVFDIYFALGTDNVQTWSQVGALPGTILSWGGNLWRGMGPLMLVALAGCVSLFALHRSFRWLCLFLLPYLAGVANNQAATELRYMVPIMGFLALGQGAVARYLQARVGAWVAWVFLAVLVAANLWHALPVLERLHTRQHFAEVAARRLMAHAPEHSLLIGAGSQNFLCVLALDSHDRPIGDRKPMGVKVSAAEGGTDYWNHPWPRANALVAYHATQGRPIFCTDEPGTEGWLSQLRGLGWRERILEKIPFQTLRGQYDRDLVLPPGQERTQPLTIFELLPPLGLPRVALRVRRAREDGIPGLRFEVEAPGQAGRHYQILLAEKVGAGLQEWVGHVDVPFRWADPFPQLSRTIGVTPPEGVRGFAGRLDDGSQAVAFLPVSHLADVKSRLMATVLILDDPNNAGTACARSAMVALPLD